MLLIKSSEPLRGGRSPGLGRALVTPGALRPAAGRLPTSEIKLTPKSAWGPRGRGDQKGKGPGRRERRSVPRLLGKRLARVSPRPILPTPLSPSGSGLCPPPRAPDPPGVARSASRALFPSPTQRGSQGRPSRPTKAPGLGWEGPEGALAPPPLILLPSHPASLSLGFAIWETGVRGFDSQRFSIVPPPPPLALWDSQGRDPSRPHWPPAPCPQVTEHAYGGAPSPRAGVRTSQTAPVYAWARPTPAHIRPVRDLSPPGTGQVLAHLPPCSEPTQSRCSLSSGSSCGSQELSQGHTAGGWRTPGPLNYQPSCPLARPQTCVRHSGVVPPSSRLRADSRSRLRTYVASRSNYAKYACVQEG